MWGTSWKQFSTEHLSFQFETRRTEQDLPVLLLKLHNRFPPTQSKHSINWSILGLSSMMHFLINDEETQSATCHGVEMKTNPLPLEVFKLCGRISAVSVLLSQLNLPFGSSSVHLQSIDDWRWGSCFSNCKLTDKSVFLCVHMVPTLASSVCWVSKVDELSTFVLSPESSRSEQGQWVCCSAAWNHFEWCILHLLWLTWNLFNLLCISVQT